MRLLVPILMACALYGAWDWWHERGPGAAAATAAMTSDNGFVPVEMPGGTPRNAVLVLAPRNCPSEQAHRTEALVAALGRAGVPVVRGDGFSFDVANPTREQMQAMDRTVEVFKRGAPAVYVNGMGMSNPSAAQAIAEYRATRARR